MFCFNTLVTSDIHGKRVNELVENDQIFEKVKSDFINIPKFWNNSKHLFLHGLDVEWKGQL